MEKIKQVAMEQDADLVGIVDIKYLLGEEMKKNPRGLMAEARTVVPTWMSFAIVLIVENGILSFLTGCYMRV